MKQNKFPPGWDEKRVQRVIEFYENQTEDEAVAEDEDAFQHEFITTVEVPTQLVHAVHKLIDNHAIDSYEQRITTKIENLRLFRAIAVSDFEERVSSMK